MGGLSDYFNLKKSFVFYGAYHHESRNQWIHMIFVPVIFTTAAHFLASVELFKLAPSTSSTLASILTPVVSKAAATAFCSTITLSHALGAFYALSFVAMEPLAGGLYAPVISAMIFAGVELLKGHTNLAITLHIVAWILQFIGHGIVEKRKPALMDNLFQSLHAAVFFVWLEWMFMFGYHPGLKKELDALVVKKMKEFKTA